MTGRGAAKSIAGAVVVGLLIAGGIYVILHLADQAAKPRPLPAPILREYHHQKTKVAKS